MATSHFVAKTSTTSSRRAAAPWAPAWIHASRQVTRRRTNPDTSIATVWMMGADMLAVIASFALALFLRFDLTVPGRGGLRLDRLMLQWSLTAGYVAFFIGAILFIGHREGLYGPLQTRSLWHEMRRTVQTCFAAALLLCGGIFVTHNTSISRAVVAWMSLFTTLSLCGLRIYWRYSLYRSYERGLYTRNVLIIGATRVGNAMRRSIEHSRQLGRRFQGFVETLAGGNQATDSEHILGDISELGQLVRQHFIDEIILAAPLASTTIVHLVEQARELDVEVLVVPGFYDELTPEAPIEFLADFPVVALHRRSPRVVAHIVKRACDILVSAFLLICLFPTLLAISLWIKLDSPGPVFYPSERVGKKGRIFSCFKFRTMVVNAEALKASLAERNERNGVLFKIKNDPRITRAGRFLRKYSLDELPQLLNVLFGDMSLVGPRPPVASEVEKYETEHFRRLEVLPGLTGLWQVRARQDPSFERYVGLDLAYVENWSIWLDFKILIRTAEVVLRGTGS